MKNIYVQTKFRKNPLSYIKGGCTLLITNKYNQTLIYDKIKYPEEYINEVLKKNDAKSIYIQEVKDGNWVLYWTIEDQKIAA
jgi:hypothetical protein